MNKERSSSPADLAMAPGGHHCGSGFTRVEVWSGVFCFIRIDDCSLEVEFDAECNYIMRFRHSRTGKEDGKSLEAAVGQALQEISGMAYRRGWSDAKDSVLAVL